MSKNNNNNNMAVKDAFTINSKYVMEGIFARTGMSLTGKFVLN